MIQLYHGDCLKLMFDLPDNSVDIVCCDMPFGTTQNSWDSVLPLDMLWHHYKRILSENGAVVLNTTQPFTTALINSNPKWFKYSWVWNKISPTGHLNAKKQPMRKTEDICVFYVKQPTYNPQGLVWNPRGKSRSPKTQGSKSYGKHGDAYTATWHGVSNKFVEHKK